MKIALVVGHDSDNQGAYGDMGISEWKFNDELLHSMHFDGSLPNKHEYYIMYRSADIRGYKAQMIDLHRRIDDIGCTLSVEMHFNSFSNENVKGHEVLACSNKGMKYAKLLNECFDKYLPTSNRGAKKIDINDRGGQFVCRGASASIISEAFFASNQHRFFRDGDLRKNLEDSLELFFNTIPLV